MPVERALSDGDCKAAPRLLPRLRESGRLPLLPQLIPDLKERHAPHRVLLGSIFNRTAQQREGIALRLLVDLQKAERLTCNGQSGRDRS